MNRHNSNHPCCDQITCSCFSIYKIGSTTTNNICSLFPMGQYWGWMVYSWRDSSSNFFFSNLFLLKIPNIKYKNKQVKYNLMKYKSGKYRHILSTYKQVFLKTSLFLNIYAVEIDKFQLIENWSFTETGCCSWGLQWWIC